MPFVDKRSGNIVIRVVYDGAPEAGKTTNLVALAERMPMQRRTEMRSPGNVSRRTEYFDWLTFKGGYVDGRRLLCQLVSVPGQPSLFRRRRYLLDSADTIVFVADSRPNKVANGRYAFELMSKAVKRHGGAVPAAVLLQANKQDLAQSLAPLELGQAMGADGEVPIIGAEAEHGIGVMETFVSAVRLGTQRIREMLLSGTRWEELGVQEDSAEELLRALETADSELEDEELDLAIQPQKREAVGLAPRPDAYVVAARPEDRHPPRPLCLPVDTVGGHVWPLARGRRTFSAVGRGVAVPSEVRQPWAPTSCDGIDVSLSGAPTWVVHTGPDWVFESALEGRSELLRQVRRLNQTGARGAPDRALWLQIEARETRLWMTTATTPSVREVLSAAVAERSTASLRSLVQALLDLLALTGDLPSLRLSCGYLDGVGISEGRAVVLAVPELASDTCAVDAVTGSMKEELFGFLRSLEGLHLSAEERRSVLVDVDDTALARELGQWMERSATGC